MSDYRDELAAVLKRSEAAQTSFEHTIGYHRVTARDIMAAGYRKSRTVGYIIVDIKTRELDWDGTLHPTAESAIESLTNPRQMWCRTPEGATDERAFYGTVYEILPVIAGVAE